MIISSFKRIDKGTLQASFDLQLPSGFFIHGVLYFVKGENAWCSFPGIPYEKNGEKTYKPLLEIPDRATPDKFNAQVIAELKKQGHV